MEFKIQAATFIINKKIFTKSPKLLNYKLFKLVHYCRHP